MLMPFIYLIKGIFFTLRSMKKIASFLCAVIFLLTACQSPPQTTTLNGQTMGTYYRISFLGDDTIDNNALYKSVETRLNDINDLMSTYQQDSQISRFNQFEQTDWFEVSAQFLYVVEAARKVYQQSDGAFDPTLAPLINLWSFGEQAKPLAIPSADKLSVALANVGFSQLQSQQNPPALKKTNTSLKLNLSAIAKGYAVDQIAELLSQQGIENYLVDIGGELKAKGVNSRKSSWTVAVEKPEAGQIGQVQQKIALTDMSIATSGSYRNFFEEAGKRYSHILSPVTGQPITHNVVSVTVLHEENMYADAYATAIMVLGEEKGYQLALQNSLPVYMIVRQAGEYQVIFTPEMNAYLVD